MIEKWQLLTNKHSCLTPVSLSDGREEQLAPGRKSGSRRFMESSLDRFSSVRWGSWEDISFRQIHGKWNTQSWALGEYRYLSYWWDIYQLINRQEQVSTGKLKVLGSGQSDGKRFSGVRLHLSLCQYSSDCMPGN